VGELIKMLDRGLRGGHLIDQQPDRPAALIGGQQPVDRVLDHRQPAQATSVTT